MSDQFSVSIRYLLCLSLALLSLQPAQAQSFRTNGKGGGAWSAPTTWEGGKVPSGGAVSILGRDVVDVDAAAGPALAIDELVIDPQGALRIVGTNGTKVAITIRKAIRVFGGLIVDLSKDPQGRCELIWPNLDGNSAEFLLNERSKIQLKAAPGVSSNVMFRALVPTNTPPATIPKAVPLTLGAKTWFEATGVEFEGFGVDVRGVDGSGSKFNEQALFRNCRFVRGNVSFSSCTKIEFEGNYLAEPPYPHVALTFNSSTHSRLVSNLVEKAPYSGLGLYGSVNCEVVGNRLRGCGDAMGITACTELFVNGNVVEENRGGITFNSCNRITGHRNVFTSNTWLNVRTINTNPNDPWRLYDCDFRTAPTNAGSASVSVEGTGPLELINSPPQTYLKESQKGPLIFSAYVDIFVTNEQNVPLGRVLLRVLSGSTVVATSRTESAGATAGHTPLPSSHRPLVVPWFRYSPPDGDISGAMSRPYTLEVDGSHLGYAKQTVPLVVDQTFVRTEPDKPTKTITVKLAKAK